MTQLLMKKIWGTTNCNLFFMLHSLPLRSVISPHIVSQVPHLLDADVAAILMNLKDFS
jgi:hypothetical protein